jgi:hypothetical protein
MRPESRSLLQRSRENAGNDVANMASGLAKMRGKIR